MIIIFVTWEKYRIVIEEMQWDSTIQPLRMAKNKTKRKRREHSDGKDTKQQDSNLASGNANTIAIWKTDSFL